jgi:hypothetical protein
MKYLIILFFLLGINLGPSMIEAEEDSLESKSDTLQEIHSDTLVYPYLFKIAPRLLKRSAPNSAFGVGEKLFYTVRYGPVAAGTASMEVIEIARHKGSKYFKIVSKAKSNKFFSVFYKVDDQAESWMDAYALYSLHFEKHLREGGYTADRYVDFDQENNLAFTGNDTIPVPECVQDVLSSLYFVRTLNLKIGNSVFIDNHADRKNYPLEMKVLRREEVEVPAGKFNCLVVKPILKATGLFKQTGELTVWLTDDQYKIPVLMKSKVAVGSISTELKSYTLGAIGKY